MVGQRFDGELVPIHVVMFVSPLHKLHTTPFFPA